MHASRHLMTPGHTYRLPLWRWFVLLGLGVIFMGAAAGLGIFAWGELLAGLRPGSDSSSLFLVIAASLLGALFLALGLTLLLAPFFTKLVLSPAELEYHTLAAVVRSDWPDLEKIDAPSAQYQAEAIVLASRQPRVSPRAWTKFVPWNAAPGAAQNGIVLSQFGKLHGRQLEAEIFGFAPRLTPTLHTVKTPAKAQTLSAKELLKTLWFFLAISLIGLIFIGQSAKLTCKHDGPTRRVSCILQRSWYGVIPLAAEEFRDVREAGLSYSRDSDGDVYYQVYLETEQGRLPLLFMDMPSYGSESDVVKRMNEFVQEPSEGTFVLEKAPRWVSAATILYLAIGTVLSGVWLFWPGEKRPGRRNSAEPGS